MGTSEVETEETPTYRSVETSGDWRAAVARRWSDALPRGAVEWSDRPRTLQNLRVVQNATCEPERVSSRILADRLALVVSGPASVAEYLDANGKGEVALPATYSAFPDGHSPVASRVAGGREYALVSNRVEAALRELNGKGRFAREEFRLVDCAPAPSVLLREGVGAVLIAPTSGTP